jgi:HEPN domain-containing protein
MSGNDPAGTWQEILAWLRIAESDQRVARLCLTADPPLCDAAAYHCQQSAEKLLKGFLVKAGLHVRKTHASTRSPGLFARTSLRSGPC